MVSRCACPYVQVSKQGGRVVIQKGRGRWWAELQSRYLKPVFSAKHTTTHLLHVQLNKISVAPH